MKKFNEASKNIFDDVSLLEDLLQDYEDNGFKYKISYNAQRKPQNNGDLYAIMTTYKWVGLDPNDIKSYIVNFQKNIMEIVTSDNQRVGRKYGYMDKKSFEAIRITDHLKNKIENMGYTLLVSFEKESRQTFDFSIMILDGVFR